MLFQDSYKTIKNSSQGVFRDRGSRFISFAEPVATADEVKILLEKLRVRFHDARHHCYAYMIGYDKSIWRVNDDGEPSGTAGKPIMGQINSHDLTNISIVVVRYFGGTLLGVRGLINAYKTAAADAISNAEIIEKTVNDFYDLKFPYNSVNDVMRVIKDENMVQSEQVFGLDCRVKIGFRLSSAERVLGRLRLIDGLKMDFIERK